MHIIPSTPYQTNSRAEIRVFKKLKESFVNDFSYVAFHSLNLTKHKTKRFGEADFVILSKFGLFVFEVKGGRIKHNEGKWSTTDKNNKTHSLQNPFRQAETALHAINKEIIESGKFPLLKLPIGFGVIVPDVQWNTIASEWDRHTICDNKNIKNFEHWLSQFFKYWQAKVANHDLLSQKTITDLKHYLRPDFELVEPLHEKLTRIEEDVVRLTEDQYKYLDIVAANKKVLCSGGAGTGKTFLAAELARRFSDIDHNIAFICKSNWLRRYLETRIQNEYVTISTIDSAFVDMRRAGVKRYDVLIVDEGQDLFDFDDIEVLDELLTGGLENGEWYIFHDANNQSGFFSETKIEVLDYLKNFNPAKIPLNTNCRNTGVILKKVQDSLHLDMGNKGTGIGPDIQELIVPAEDYTKVLANELNKLLKDGISPDSITILSPHSFEKSSVFALPEKLRNKIIKLDDYSIRSFPINEISFSQIRDFKGLENEVIIVIDLKPPQSINEGENKAEHYVAMSRARGLLCVLWH